MPAETQFLLALAGQGAIAIHNSQLYEEIRVSNAELEKTTLYLNRSLKRLSSLYTALTPISAASSTEEILNQIADRLLDGTGADAALIRVWDKNADSYPISRSEDSLTITVNGSYPHHGGEQLDG